MGYLEGVGRVSEGVLRLSGGCLDGVWGCLRPPEYCQGGINANQSEKSSSSVILFSHGLFSQWCPKAIFEPSMSNFQVGVVGCFLPPVIIFFGFPSLVMVKRTP